MGRASEAMIEEQEKEAAKFKAREADLEFAADINDEEKTRIINDGLKHIKIYFYIKDYELADYLDLMEHFIYDTTVADYIKLTNFINTNARNCLSSDFSDAGVAMYATLDFDEIEKKVKEDFYPCEDTFEFKDLENCLEKRKKEAA